MADGVTIAVPLPHMGVSVEEATVIAWHRAVGDAVRAGEPLCDVATDKVDTEIAAPADGVLARIVVAVGDTVAVGGLLAELSGAGAVADEPAPVTGVPATVRPHRFDPAAAATQAVSRGAGRRDGGPVCSPLARRLAAEYGVDLSVLTGTGLGGRIGKADVLSAVAARGPADVAQVAVPAVPAVPTVAAAGPGGLPRGYDDVPHEIVPTTRQRRVTAEHMIRSRQTAAHMTTEAEVDMSAAARARDQLNRAAAASGDIRLSYLALIARVACAALQEYPDLNATFELERLIRWREVNLGIAVDTDAGLIVPVIRGCERLTAPGIAAAIADLAARARERRLTPDDLRAGTFTLSNPGSAGGFAAMAIINQPQVAILGTPVIVRRPWVVVDGHGGEAIAIRPIMTLTLTFDHRAVDGAEATRCVVAMKRLLETWDAVDYA